MTFYVDEEVDIFEGPDTLTESVNEDKFDLNEITGLVIKAVLASEKCPYETQVNIVLTDNEGIKKINLETRAIDKPTDVLSFPVLTFKDAADFSEIAEKKFNKLNRLNFDPDSGELLLGDIIISVEKLREQAVLYGHCLKREYAFLLTHSLLHLLGYDHNEADKTDVMEKKQEAILSGIGINRKGNKSEKFFKIPGKT
ncbi:MAG: rRNA maturation RNase YbeY [Lachnospiraceae bacterium]|nr:rRNA maturation RNase YbeY [Lachnospiraceae bacterium]